MKSYLDNFQLEGPFDVQTMMHSSKAGALDAQQSILARITSTVDTRKHFSFWVKFSPFILAILKQKVQWAAS